jgi:co-chaperonin GroES (HSP10)
MTMELNPLFSRVLIRRERFASKSSSIIIPEEAAKRNAPVKGEVVAVGPGADASIREGMTVIFGQYAGAWINAEGAAVAGPEEAEFFVCMDEDIIAEVKER